MCNQTVGLIQGALEEAGIASVSLTLLEVVTRKVRPPRALFFPFPFGYPLGEPGEPAVQRRVILESFEILKRADLPVLERFSEQR
ncbi:MAG TPA: hypothetical protein VIC04_06230 [Terriglobia bacterium]|jgi:hypothetical protein